MPRRYALCSRGSISSYQQRVQNRCRLRSAGVNALAAGRRLTIIFSSPVKCGQSLMLNAPHFGQSLFEFFGICSFIWAPTISLIDQKVLNSNSILIKFDAEQARCDRFHRRFDVCRSSQLNAHDERQEIWSLPARRVQLSLVSVVVTISTRIWNHHSTMTTMVKIHNGVF